MNYGDWGCSLQKDKQEDGEMESVGVDGTVALLGFLITPSGLEQYAAGHRVTNRVASPAAQGKCQENIRKQPPFLLGAAADQGVKDTTRAGWSSASKNTQLPQTTQSIKRQLIQHICFCCSTGQFQISEIPSKNQRPDCRGALRYPLLRNELVCYRKRLRQQQSASGSGRIRGALTIVLTRGQEAVIDVKCVKKTLVTQRYSREPLFPSPSCAGSAAWLSHQGPSSSSRFCPPIDIRLHF